jgi:hypothetical protein
MAAGKPVKKKDASKFVKGQLRKVGIETKNTESLSFPQKAKGRKAARPKKKG